MLYVLVIITTYIINNEWIHGKGSSQTVLFSTSFEQPVTNRTRMIFITP